MDCKRTSLSDLEAELPKVAHRSVEEFRLKRFRRNHLIVSAGAAFEADEIIGVETEHSSSVARVAVVSGTESLQTHRWREMDSNFWYAAQKPWISAAFRALRGHRRGS